MEAQVIHHEVKVTSRSPLHAFITGPEIGAQPSRSRVTPYRKRQGILSVFGISEVLAQVKKEEALAQESKIAAKETEESWNLSDLSEPQTVV